MNGFVAKPPPSDPVNDSVAGDDFWPACSIAEFRDLRRMPDKVTDARCRSALRAGMLAIRRQLRDWRTGFPDAATMADIDSEQVDGESALALLYRRGVFAHAAADLADTHHSISATEAGRDRIEDEATAAAALRREATHAVRDILGEPRMTVELI